MNRAFIYGDLLFETIKLVDEVPQLLLLHYNRLVKSAHLLKFEINLSFDSFELAIISALRENNLKSARIRFVLHRNANGFYNPLHNKTSFFVEVFPLVEFKHKPIGLGLYTDNYKTCTELSNIKSGNALLYVLAGIWAKEEGFDDALILNEHGFICEATSSNVFMVKNEIVYTPALTEGCVDGVMRRHILYQLKQADYEVNETLLSVDQLYDADTVFLTSAINGLLMIDSFNEKKYTPISLRL